MTPKRYDNPAKQRELERRRLRQATDGLPLWFWDRLMREPPVRSNDFGPHVRRSGFHRSHVATAG